MIRLDSEIELNKLRSNINVDKINIRKIYDRSIKYAYGENKPLEIKESIVMKSMVNHIRHKYSDYEKSLKTIRKINDIEQTQYKLYKNSVLNEISKKYPMLKEECDNQKIELEMIKEIK